MILRIIRLLLLIIFDMYNNKKLLQMFGSRATIGRWLAPSLYFSDSPRVERYISYYPYFHYGEVRTDNKIVHREQILR